MNVFETWGLLMVGVGISDIISGSLQIMPSVVTGVLSILLGFVFVMVGVWRAT